MRDNIFRTAAALAFAACSALSAFGYDLIYGQAGARVTWNAGSIPFVIRMSQTANLQDGTSYASSVQAAMDAWNGQVTQVQFAPSVAASGLANDGDGVNEIAFDTKIYSNSTDPDNPPQDFGENTLAVTLSWVATSARGDGTYQRTQSDILFNSKWTWDSYRGNLQQPEDIRRVAIHELGHVLGLDHPDQDGQTVTAIMNAYVSNIDSLQTDDLTGAQLLYGRPGGYTAPGNDNFASATTITLSNNSATLTASNVGATKESGEPSHVSSRDGASIWWKWTAPKNGKLTVNTLGSNFDTMLAIYTGSAVNSLSLLGGNDDASDDPNSPERRSKLENLSVTSGTTYSIAVVGWDAQWGNVTLNVNFTPDPDTAPTVTAHPSSTTVTQGQSAVFSVSYSSPLSVTFAWDRLPAGSSSWASVANGTSYSGATTSQLTVTSTAAMHGDQFRCRLTNSVGTTTTNTATLSVNQFPYLATQPSSVTVETGSVAQFSVVAGGSPPFSYRWESNLPGGWTTLADGGAFTGATTPTLSIVTIAGYNNASFRCVVSNLWGYATSSAAILGVQDPLRITAQPANDGTFVGQSIALSVTAVSSAAITYQWQKNGVDIPGATAATYAIASFQLTDVANYRVKVSSGSNTIFSDVARLEVALPPTITTPPASLEVYAGTSATFTVSAASNAKLSYLWFKDGTLLTGATTSTLTLSNVQAADAGAYSVTVSNVAGAATSSDGTLTVLPSSAPVITLQPQSKTVMWQARTSFSVGASGAPSPSYRWQRLPVGTTTWVDVEPGISQFYTGETTPTLLLNVGTLLGNNGDKFRCIVSNVAGTVMSNEATLTVVTAAAALRAAAGDAMTLIVRNDVRAWSTGANFAGQLGDGTTTAGTLLKQIGSPTDVVDVAAGFEHSFFLKADGTLWAAGDNQVGELGDGTTTARPSPVQVATNVASAAGGYRHSLFRKTDGTLWAMGLNSSGQLGDGTAIARSVPVQIASEVTAISAGFAHSMFVKTDGTAWATGANAFGQFGDGTTTSRSTPAQVATNIKDLAGFYHTLFLKRDGTLWAAGRNDSGQLGDGSTTTRATPVQVASNVVAIAAGAFHSVYLKADGTAWTMGLNSYGQLGDGTTTPRTTPIQVATDVAAIGGGIRQTFLVKIDGTLWAAGDNTSGQLGDGTTTPRTTFVQVASGGAGLPADYTHPTATNSASATRIAITWPHSRGALHYRVWRHTANNSAAATLLADRVAGNFHADLTAASGVNYYYWVQPVNQFGELSVGASALGRWGAAGVAPTVTTAPASQTVNVGTSVTFTVVAAGTAPLTYQWRHGGNAIDGATAASYTIASAQIAAAGAYDVVVTNAFGSATSSAATLAVNQLGQTITFAALPDVAFRTTPITLTASASSSLPVSFTLVSGPATLDGTALTITAAGDVTVRASQSGDATYAAAASIDRSFTVTKAPATVTLGALSATYDGAAKSATATTNPASLAVTLTYDGVGTAPTGAGSYAVAATIDDTRYQGTASDTLTIAKAAQTITFAALVDQAFSPTPLTLSATSSANLSVSFTVLSGPATLNGSALTLTGAGIVTIRAAQSGNANYLAAPSVDRSFTVAGSFDAWLREHFSAAELLDATISGPNADPDADGFANLVEYALGIDPRADSSAAAPQMGATATDWTFTYTRPADRVDLTYSVEYSTNLTTWSSAGVTHTLVSSSNGTETWHATYPVGSASACFLRLVVTR